MDGSGEAGVILFSLGYTGFEASAVPGEVMGAFLSAFARLQQRVLLRFNPALLPTTPDNVMVMDWLPQHDILGRLVLCVWDCGWRCIGVDRWCCGGGAVVGGSSASLSLSPLL